jgi:hypothetical protein
MGSRTRDLPTCTAVPKPTALPRAPVYTKCLLFSIIRRKCWSNTTNLIIDAADSPRDCLCVWCYGPTRVLASSSLRFLDHTQRRTTFGRTPLDEWSARRRDLYPTTHNTHKRQTSMPPAGFEPTIPASERQQTHTLDRAAFRDRPLKYYVSVLAVFVSSYTMF